MEPTSLAFNANARRALHDEHLQKALGKARAGFQVKRQAAADRLPEFEDLRDAAAAIKDHALANLDAYLEAFERKATEAGATVHWARDAAEARDAVLGICRETGARTVTKSKSMIAEEIGLNPFLEANGVAPIETDLGEYIIQLADHRPSHIIAPAVHMTKDQVSDLFHEHHGTPRLEDPAALLGEARQILRRKYLEADVGVTGANFLIAETGSAVTVTNEGNAELTHALPRVHVVIASLEKVIPTVADAWTLLRVLARSATGQEASVYTTFITGPKRPGDLDGPEQLHFILLDNGRSEMLGSEFREMLRCIRCGACMNHCPVYLATGGHAWGWVYVGPMGNVLTPQLIGIERSYTLPNASTFCGRCEEVCPVRIPLPKLMRHWREVQFDKGLNPPTARYGLGLWAFAAKRPALYHRGARLAIRLLGMMGRRKGRFRRLPLAGGWTCSRDLPAPQGATFQEQWRARRGRERTPPAAAAERRAAE